MAGCRLLGSSDGREGGTRRPPFPPTIEMTFCGQFGHGELAGVAEIDRPVTSSGVSIKRDQAVDQVVDEAEGSRLQAVAEDGQRLALQSLRR